MEMTKEEAFKMLQGKKVYAGEYNDPIKEKLMEIGFVKIGSNELLYNGKFIVTFESAFQTYYSLEYYQELSQEEITISQILGIELEDEFKDGDILHSDLGGENINFILKNSLTVGGFYFYYASMSNTLGLIFDNNCWPKDVTVRYATKEECDKLLNAIDKQGYKWNSEEKKIEKKRWRANKGEKYYCIDESVCVYGYTKYNDNNDDMYYNAHNYFKTEQEAQQYADKIKELLQNR